MSHSRGVDEFEPRGGDEPRDEPSVIALFAILALLFVDVSLPVIGSSNRMLAVVVFALLFFGRSRISTPFCATVAFLLPMYYLVPPLLHPEVDSHDFGTVLLFQLTAVGAMVLLARAMAIDDQRRQLADMLIVFAIASAIIAVLQRYGALDALGRNRWGHALTASQSLRGAGLMSDPNFLAILLASVIPLAVNWRLTRFRWLAVVILGAGVYATDSRSGLLLAALALILSITVGTAARGTAPRSSRQIAVAVIATGLVILFALNIGGQRDRVVEGVLIGIGVNEVSTASADLAAAQSAHTRREALREWVNVGLDGLPFGVGIGPDDGFVTRSSQGIVAHNSFVSAFAEGGVAGLLFGLTSLMCLACFIRRRTDPFAIVGMIAIAGGLFVTYAWCLILPLGLADGIRAARLGIGRDTAAPESHRPTYLRTTSE